MDAAEVGEFLSDKRARKKGKRQARKWKARLAHNLHQEQLEDAFGKRSKIIKMLADEYDFDNDTIRATDYRPKRNNHGGTVARTGRFVVSVPHNFSIIEEPSLALATIGNFAKTIQQSQIRSVVLDHSRVQKYDLAANSLLDIIAVELKQQTRRSNRKVRWEGRYPKDPHINRFIRALGIIKLKRTLESRQ